MKTLYLVRHAKSSWDDPTLADFDRPLNERGKRDATRMGKRLKEKNIYPSLILSSPAKRAHSTCKRIADALGYPRENIRIERNLYHADEEDILAIARRQDPQIDSILICAHNPGITDFVNALTRGEELVTPKLPTCGHAAFRFAIDDWNLVDFGNGELMFIDYPKKTG